MVCVKWRVFLKQQLILTKVNRPCNKLNYPNMNVGLKLQRPQPSVLIVFPPQIIKYLRFL